MDFEAEVSYGSGQAWYSVTKENPGIYSACLLTFDGDEDHFPPAEITLIRGVRNWTGSENDEHLINALGELIEAHFMPRPHIQK